ncbi:hypothetical protein B0H67DRAFT_549291 [Lasiosphaeris hirsuta]|uniref:Ubiquitin carboxyl-terminal hydrolase n=1 Tax=Lasiosphaeris hirsuta TaxID=260670 RepID=A0AA40BCB8_9PEZI|nr:hypothetical protein B0H67DRAFT_549291 [Lasiosphaeris hirsuta]
MATNTGKKMFTILENNPEVMNALALKLGLSPTLTFHDIYSLSPADLTHIPRPALALLAIIPLTPSWAADRTAEDAAGTGLAYHAADQPSPAPIIWLKQTIGNACGSIGLVHCALNGPAAQHVLPGSTLAQLRDAAVPLAMEERAQMLHDSDEFEAAHKAVVELGDTAPPTVEGEANVGQHFVAFVKAEDGHLWELEGSRLGPIDRGELGADEDVLSPRALELGLGRVIKLEEESGGGDLRFSCIALTTTEG